MYQIRILDPATQELARLDKQIGRRIVERIHWLAENIDDIKYEILHDERVIVIHLVGHRREVYR